jgi:acyl-CoA synthetase (AMP-forming)/AMP-acid ligase II
LLPYQPAESQPALVSFSSGSSGLPKAVIRTHAQLNAQFEALRQHFPLQAGGTICTNFPVVILLNLGLGLHTFISKTMKLSNLAKTDFEALHAEIIGKQISCLAFSPFVVDSLSVYLLQQHKKASSVRQILTGGSPFFPAFAIHVQQAFPQTSVNVLYGSSEAEPIAFCDARDVIRYQYEQGLFAGKTDRHTDCKIEALDQAGMTESKAGKSGEILVSGDHVVTDYYESPLALAKNKVRQGGKIWHRTGDYGYFDAMQHLFLTGKPQYNSGTECLLDAEKKLAGIPGVGRATLLNHIVYIQKHSFADKKAIEKQVRTLFSEVKKVKFMKLPLDKRHHGKIKYEQLS